MYIQIYILVHARSSCFPPSTFPKLCLPPPSLQPWMLQGRLCLARTTLSVHLSMLPCTHSHQCCHVHTLSHTHTHCTTTPTPHTAIQDFWKRFEIPGAFQKAPSVLVTVLVVLGVAQCRCTHLPRSCLTHACQAPVALFAAVECPMHARHLQLLYLQWLRVGALPALGRPGVPQWGCLLPCVLHCVALGLWFTVCVCVCVCGCAWQH